MYKDELYTYKNALDISKVGIYLVKDVVCKSKRLLYSCNDELNADDRLQNEC